MCASLYYVCVCVCSKVLALREGEGETDWESMELCMGDSSVCTGSLVGQARKKHILSFGEDEDGELYILATSRASTTDTGGVVYQIVDPARSVLGMLRNSGTIRFFTLSLFSYGSMSD